MQTIPLTIPSFKLNPKAGPSTGVGGGRGPPRVSAAAGALDGCRRRPPGRCHRASGLLSHESVNIGGMIGPAEQRPGHFISPVRPDHRAARAAGLTESDSLSHCHGPSHGTHAYNGPARGLNLKQVVEYRRPQIGPQ